MRTPEWYAMRMEQNRRQQEPKPVKAKPVKVKAVKVPIVKAKKPAKVKTPKLKPKAHIRTKSISLPEPPKVKDVLLGLAQETIMLVKGWGGYSIVYDHEKAPLLTYSTLKKYEVRLPEFIRVHKTYLVNPRFIKCVNIDSLEGTIEMQNGTTIPISRRKISVVSQFVDTIPTAAN